ncbi:hypothetical protein QUA20_04455 [Microcoleus sp. Pol7_A1]|uniref:hypothetical protein n=1 Tax=Microcoleus sp. Pol7_A1 TaxID=2818893 RepID=UPI002FD5F064
MTWKTILSFIVSATVLTLLSGWLMVANLLPIQAAIDYSERAQALLPIGAGLTLTPNGLNNVSSG